MDLVEHDELGILIPLLLQDEPFVSLTIIAKISGGRELLRDLPDQGGFSTLTRAADKNHFFLQIFQQVGR
jgi:hypothetical protein